MNHILVSNIISERIFGAEGKEVLILNLELVNYRDRNFELLVIVKEHGNGKEEIKTYKPIQSPTNMVYFSGASVQLSAGQSLHFQLKCPMPILGKLQYRLF